MKIINLCLYHSAGKIYLCLYHRKGEISLRVYLGESISVEGPVPGQNSRDVAVAEVVLVSDKL